MCGPLNMTETTDAVDASFQEKVLAVHCIESLFKSKNTTALINFSMVNIASPKYPWPLVEPLQLNELYQNLSES